MGSEMCIRDSNGTYFVDYTNTIDESKELGARVSIDGMWKDTVMTVYFPPIEAPEEQVGNQSDSVTESPNHWWTIS